MVIFSSGLYSSGMRLELISVNGIAIVTKRSLFHPQLFVERTYSFSLHYIYIFVKNESSICVRVCEFLQKSLLGMLIGIMLNLQMILGEELPS